MRSFNYKQALLAVVLASALTGCGSMRDYKSETDSVVTMANSGQIDSALATLESNNKDDKDLLYYFERGMLQHIKNDIPPSKEAWLAADSKVREWEDAVKTNPDKFFGDVGSFLVNDKTRRYDGYDYEKVMLSTFLAMDHVMLGNWGDARTEIKKTHEREAIIAEFRAKEYEKREADAKEKNVKTTYKELQGYPVETLDDPEVKSLKNGYQSAFSHYLAGFVYEALGEPSLAAPGYRKAIELRPNIKILEDGLSGVDTRAQRLKPNETDVLFVIESGTAPARQSMAIPLPFPWRGGVSYTQVSFPVIRPDRGVYIPTTLSVGNRNLNVSQITSLDAMSRRALRDDMPGIILRSVVRAVIKGGATAELGQKAGVFGTLAGAVVTAVTEQADERTWRTLPSQISVARAVLPAGPQTLIVPTPTGPQKMTVEIGGGHEIVPIRLMGHSVYLVQPVIASASQMASFQQDSTASKADTKPKAKKTVKPTKKAK